VYVEFDMIHAEAMLEATVLVLQMVIVSDLQLVISTGSFMARYHADRLLIHNLLTSHCLDHQKACFVWYFSIRHANWFHRME
jgi:hypothetical protein